jgi:hypothetical protein
MSNGIDSVSFGPVGKTFFALIAVKRGAILNSEGKDFDVFRFLATGGREIKIIPHVKTFVYFNPVKQTFDIHEQACGLMIANGKNMREAIDETAKFFKEANEVMFFKQVEALGPSHRRPCLPWETAMQHYESGNTFIDKTKKS